MPKQKIYGIISCLWGLRQKKVVVQKKQINVRSAIMFVGAMSQARVQVFHYPTMAVGDASLADSDT